MCDAWLSRLANLSTNQEAAFTINVTRKRPKKIQFEKKKNENEKKIDLHIIS